MATMMTLDLTYVHWNPPTLRFTSSIIFKYALIAFGHSSPLHPRKIYLVGTALSLTPSCVVSSQTSISLEILSTPFNVRSCFEGVRVLMERSEESNASGYDFQIY